MTILPHEAKALLEVFCLQQIVIGELQNSSSSSLASWGKIKIHDFTLADQDWIGLMDDFQKFCGSGLDSILSDQDWTRTEKFHSPFTSGEQ